MVILLKEHTMMLSSESTISHSLPLPGGLFGRLSIAQLGYICYTDSIKYLMWGVTHMKLTKEQRKQLEDFWYEEHRKEGYEFIKTPIMLNQELWEISGHWFNYKENMYTSEIDDKAFAIKPMNCPGGMLYYKENIHKFIYSFIVIFFCFTFFQMFFYICNKDPPAPWEAGGMF